MYRSWKVFIHIDSAGQRIHGDHYPVEGLYSTKDWRLNSLIQDTHVIKVKPTIKPAVFKFYVGLYHEGSKKRMTILNPESEGKTKDNRALISQKVWVK